MRLFILVVLILTGCGAISESQPRFEPIQGQWVTLESSSESLYFNWKETPSASQKNTLTYGRLYHPSQKKLEFRFKIWMSCCGSPASFKVHSPILRQIDSEKKVWLGALSDISFHAPGNWILKIELLTSEGEVVGEYEMPFEVVE